MSTEPGILIHYLRMACETAGVAWDWNNSSELLAIEDEIRKIARAELADEIDGLRERVRALENQ